MCLCVGKKRGQLDWDHCFLEVKIYTLCVYTVACMMGKSILTSECL